LRLRWWVGGLLLLALVLVAGRITSRAYQYERSTFQRQPGALVKPPDLELIDVHFPTPAGEVRGWWAPPRNRAGILFAHGSRSDRRGLLTEARWLIGAGFGVLMLDLPGCGESAGRTTWGAPEVAALRAGLNWMVTSPEVDSARIGGLGFSMGSAMMILTAAEDSRLKSVALLGSFPTYEDQLRASFNRLGPLTGQAAIWGAEAAGASPRELRPVDQIGRLAGRPLLFIAGDRDRDVPPRLSLALYRRAPEPKQLWLAQGAGHGGYAQADSAGYATTLVGFFRTTLLR
jgi:dipeptidyl aminopeptidase/acylaminoacyl peptidase